MEKAKQIIIVDDDRAILDSTRIMMERSGYGVTVFENGDPLISGPFEVPDLFILDKQLPGVDGLDICRHLKGQDSTKHIPVLILSASPQIGKLAKEACADEFLAKPFKMQSLREIIERLINK